MSKFLDQKAETVRKHLDKLLERYQILYENIFHIFTDNGTNFIKAYREDIDYINQDLDEILMNEQSEDEDLGENLTNKQSEDDDSSSEDKINENTDANDQNLTDHDNESLLFAPEVSSNSRVL